MKNKLVVSVLGVSILVGGMAPSLQVLAAEPAPTVEMTQPTLPVAYDEQFIVDLLDNSDLNYSVALPYKEGQVQVPEGFTYSVVTNPYTNQSFYKIERGFAYYGFKKFAIVNAFRYGGKALSVVMDVVSPATAKYIKKNSGKIANAIDGASDMLHGAIYQSLLKADVPKAIARNIAWAIDAFLL